MARPFGQSLLIALLLLMTATATTALAGHNTHAHATSALAAAAHGDMSTVCGDEAESLSCFDQADQAGQDACPDSCGGSCSSCNNPAVISGLTLSSYKQPFLSSRTFSSPLDAHLATVQRPPIPAVASR